jgi:predicted Zn-dependent protease
MADSPRLEQIRALLRDDPDDPFLQYGLAMEYLSLDDAPAAAIAFRELMTRKPDYVPTYLMLGQTLQRLGREQEAADVLRLGVKAAKTAGDEHALSEIQGLLAIVE